jgi:hypothetical protein
MGVRDLARRIREKVKPRVTESYESKRARSEVDQGSTRELLGPSDGMTGNTERF